MPSEAQEFINEVWGLQGVAYLVLGLRYYSRAVTLGWRKFALDDFLIAVASVSKPIQSLLRPWHPLPGYHTLPPAETTLGKTEAKRGSDETF